MKDFKRNLANYKFFRKGLGSRPIYTRAGLIADFMVGQKYSVHTGSAFRSIIPKAEMVSSSIGFYIFTKINGSSIHKRKRKKKEKKKRGRKL